MEAGATGRLGVVVHRIRGGEAPGEVRVVHDGMAHDYLAYCTEPLPVGQHVLVINDRGARRIDVEPWLTPCLGTESTEGS
jgi:membrane protein implicated in regulation of membrane protease activity